MAAIVVRHPVHVTRPQRQERLGALKGLDLALLVHTQHQGLVGRVQIQAHDVAHLLDEEGVVGDLKAPLTVRLEAEDLPDSLHGGLGDAAALGHGAHAPVCALGRPAARGALDELGHCLVLNGPGAARPNLVVEALYAVRQVTSAPVADSEAAKLQGLGYGYVGLTVGAHQDDACAVGQGAGHRAAGSETLQLRALLLRKDDLLSALPHTGPPERDAHMIVGRDG